MRTWLKIVSAVFLSLWLGWHSPLGVSWGIPFKEKVKAAFIYKFTKFVEWPFSDLPKPGGKFIIGVLGKTEMKEALKSISHKLAKGFPIKIAPMKSLKSIKKCHVLFISGEEKKRLPAIVKTLKGTNVLTIGDYAGFAEAGGMINFYIMDDRVRFEINLDRTKETDLVISSQLLRVAKIIRAE